MVLARTVLCRRSRCAFAECRTIADILEYGDLGFNFALLFQMLFEFESHQDSHAFHSIVTTSRTPCVEVIQMAVRKFDLPGDPKEYFLVEISEENEGEVTTNVHYSRISCHISIL